MLAARLATTAVDDAVGPLRRLVEGILDQHPLRLEQRRIVEWGEGPAVVIAGAGTGKTRVIVERIRHLLDTGRRRLAFVGGPTSIRQVADRLQGARRAVKEEPDATLEVLESEGQTVLAGRSVGNSLVERGREGLPDGIFCANDLMALGCIEALKELGKSIPADVAVVGFDNRDIAQFTLPPLTTFHLPMFEMGSMAVEIIADIAGGLNSSHDQLKVECHLVERQSA